jgi:ubiquinone/menaquinone biosynthesis C-methylase UbiE
MQLDYLQAKFAQPVYPILNDPAFKGMYTLRPDYHRSELVGVTDQFLEHADDYDAKYFHYTYWKCLLQMGLAKAHFSESAPEVLDLGSGSGNSALPILELFGNARVVATDISPQLLLLLRKHLSRYPDRLERCGMVCADATEVEFRPQCFDLVIGGAILHHLLDPAHAIRQACSCVRAGGAVVFFEPFEFGSAMLRVIYEQLIAQRRDLRLSDAVVDLFQRIVTDVKVRAGRDMADAMFRQLDDKWLFTRTYFEEQARRNNASLTIVPLHALGESFQTQTRTYLRIVLNCDDSALAQPGWDLLKYYDEVFSQDLKREMLLEGCVILQK